MLESIEFSNYNVVQGYKFYKLIRENRQKRHKISIKLQQLESLTSNIDIQQTIVTLSNALADIYKISNPMITNNISSDLLDRIS